MNKELISREISAQDSFTAELEVAVGSILNHMSDADLDRLLKGEDHTFLNKETPSGDPLVATASEEFGASVVYWWSDFALKTKFHAGATILKPFCSAENPDQAADRQDLALAA